MFTAGTGTAVASSFTTFTARFLTNPVTASTSDTLPVTPADTVSTRAFTITVNVGFVFDWVAEDAYAVALALGGGGGFGCSGFTGLGGCFLDNETGFRETGNN